MDIAAIPRVNSLVLTGLDFSMKPEHARFESKKGFIKPFHELKVMHLIKSLAVIVYNQEKLTPYFHGNVCDGRNSLAYFICAMHRQQAPQPMTKSHSRANSTASNESNWSKSTTSSSSCPLPNPGENCDLPKLCTTSMLPLGYWDSLYYALIAEIRQLHAEITAKYGFACMDQNPILHDHGPDGTTDQPITAIDLASMLETAWYALMDTRLVATLDDAVRMRNLRENAAQEEVDSAAKLFMTDITQDKSNHNHSETEATDDSAWPPPTVEGLIDVNALTPEAIISLLWEKHAAEINRACLEDCEDETMLTVYRAELHAKEVEAAVAASTPLPSASFCTCHRICVCSFNCDAHTDKCTCLNGRAQIYHLIRQQESRKHELYTTYEKADSRTPNPFLGAATNTLAQLQIAAIANRDPVIVQACYNIHEATNARDIHVASKLRQRANTSDSDLAYVPQYPTSNPAPKDPYPLDFYGAGSPQRYPKMGLPSSSSQSAKLSSSFNAGNSPTRKPVPPPITTSINSYRPSNIQPEHHIPAITPPSSAHHDTGSFSKIKYPTIPASQSDSMFTQSFPTIESWNPRSMAHHPNRDQKTAGDASSDPAQQYIGLLGRHPSTIECGERPNEPFPRLCHDATGNAPGKAISTSTLPTLKTLNPSAGEAQSLHAAPEFLAPRPAIKQRYVSAGGDAKFSERAEITGPTYTSPMPAVRGFVSKEVVDAKMNDPEWVRLNFGEAAVGLTGSLTPPRRSGESTKNSSKRNSGRKSDESDRSKGDKRDRTSSGASGRVAKLKRVFSRKDSGTELE